MKFSVATNFQPGLVDAMAGYPVAEFFGKLPADRIGGGRASFMLSALTAKQFKEHVARAARKGIGFNYLLNPACMDNREYTRSGQRDLEHLLDFVEECGVAAVTVSLPFLLPVIKRRHPRLKVRVGVYARVDGIAKARYWEDLGADCITLESISVNRNFPLLRALRDAVRIELQLIANSNCMMFCPLSGQHMVNLSHASRKGHASRGFMIDYCALKCSYDKLREPSLYLRSEFIRPEDLGLYTAMGFSSFKILERGAPTPVLAARVRAYAERSWDGNLLDLIQPFGYRERVTGGMSGPGNIGRFLGYFFRPHLVKMAGVLKLKKLAEKRGLLGGVEGEPVYVDNRGLDGFLDGMRHMDCRSIDCTQCGYCAAWAEKTVKVDSQYREEMMRLYADAFEEMHSGALWGIGGRHGA